MNSLQNLVVIVQVISALAIIGLVLLQHGKGADMGAAFGSGASGSLFGATGSSNFMSKSTGVAAAIFFISTLILANFATHKGDASGGIMEKAVPAAPVTGTGAIPTTAPVAPPVAAPAAAAPVAAVPAPVAAPAPATPAGQVPK